MVSHVPRVNDSSDASSAQKYWIDQLGMSSEEDKRAEARRKAREELDNTAQPHAFEREEVISAAEYDLNFLAGLAMPHMFEFLFPKTHQAAWQILSEMESDGTRLFPQLALGIPRGHAKTTLIKLYILKLVLFSKRNFVCIMANTEARAADILKDVAAMLDEGNVKTIFGDWRLGIEIDRITYKVFGYRGRVVTLLAVGAEGSIRGVNINNQRPDVMVFDDIQTKECADSKEQSDALSQWMVGTAMKAKSPKRCMFIFAGNMFATPHSILKQLKTNSNWVKFISGAILADGSALWPELRSKESLIEEFNNDIAMGHPEIFFSEVLNDTNAGVNSTVDYSKFAQWDWTREDLPQGKFVIVDPSQGKGLDSDVIMYVEVYDETPGVREIIEEHLSPSNLVKRALILAIENDVRLIAVESMAYQYTLLHWFEKACEEFSITGIQFVSLYATTTSKNSRISGGLKALQAKDIILHPSIRSRVMKQISDWNPIKKHNVDDILDCIAYIPKVMAEYTYDIQVQMTLDMTGSLITGVQEDNHSF